MNSKNPNNLPAITWHPSTLLLFAIISLLSCNHSSENAEPVRSKQKHLATIGQYKYDPNTIHQVIAITSESTLLSDRDYLRKFNSENEFSNLKVTAFTFPNPDDASTPILAIGKFKNELEAKVYIESFSEREASFPIKNILPISFENYRTFLINKNLEEYVKFYDESQTN